MNYELHLMQSLRALDILFIVAAIVTIIVLIGSVAHWIYLELEYRRFTKNNTSHDEGDSN